MQTQPTQIIDVYCLLLTNISKLLHSTALIRIKFRGRKQTLKTKISSITAFRSANVHCDLNEENGRRKLG